MTCRPAVLPRGGVRVATGAGLPELVQLNTTKPPFDDVRAAGLRLRHRPAQAGPPLRWAGPGAADLSSAAAGHPGLPPVLPFTRRSSLSGRCKAADVTRTAMRCVSSPLARRCWRPASSDA